MDANMVPEMTEQDAAAVDTRTARPPILDRGDVKEALVYVSIMGIGIYLTSGLPFWAVMVGAVTAIGLVLALMICGNLYRHRRS